MKVGEIEVLPVFDGFGYEVARDVLLRPTETDPWARHQERLDAHGRLEFTLGGFLVRTGGRTVLVDAGAGTIDTGQYKGGQLLTSLAKPRRGTRRRHRRDIHPPALRSRRLGDVQGRGGVPQRHLPGPRGGLGLFRGEPGCRARRGAEAIPGQAAAGDVHRRVRAGAGAGGQAGAGHTPGSTIFVLSSGTQRALLLGDVAHCTVELTEPGWEFVFDVDRAAARAVRQQITAELLDTQDPAAAAHFPDPQFGRLVRAGQAEQAGQAGPAEQAGRAGWSEKTWMFL